MSTLNSQWRLTSDLARKLRFPFSDTPPPSINQSQAWQDLFVLSMLHGKRGGKYLEIGAQVPINNNNTWLLSEYFDWSGISIEIDPIHFRAWRETRSRDPLLISDALKIDYESALSKWFKTANGRIDYLQLDIDPSINTLHVLNRLPLDKWRFSVITFETDAYTGDLRARDSSREILSAHGYRLVGADMRVLFEMASPSPIAFEDWWIDPIAIAPDVLMAIDKLQFRSGMPQDLLFID